MNKIIRGFLPPRSHYREAKRDASWITFIDGKCDRFTVSLPLDGDWGRCWEIAILENFNKSDSCDYLSRIRLKCMKVVPQEDLNAVIHREIYKGLAAHAYDCISHYAAPCGDRLWCDYTIVRINAFLTRETGVTLPTF